MKRAAGFNIIELTLVLGILAVLGILSVGALKQVQLHRAQAQGVHHCQQIIFALRQFARDHEGQYPDSVADLQSGMLAQNANDAFRQLIKRQLVKDEQIFGCANGFNPDGNIGNAPECKMALLSDENHWAMTAGQKDCSVANMPLVFENPASGSWPPRWNDDIHARGKGCAWPDGRIIIGRNDGSVAVEKLDATKGVLSPKRDSKGMDCFTRASQGAPQRVLPAVSITPR